MDLLLTTTSGMNISLNTAIPGAKGESIRDVLINSNGDLTVSLTNGTIINAGNIGVIAEATEAKNIAVDASSTATAQANIANTAKTDAETAQRNYFFHVYLLIPLP